MTRLRSIGVLAAELALLALIAALFTLRTPPVVGASMEPRIRPGEIVAIETLAYRWRPVRRGDLVAFRRDAPTPQTFLKRVVGLPGERIEIRAGEVFVDGRRLDEPYVAHRDGRSVPPTVVPARAYYVLGDNRPASDDSRDWGPVGQGALVGEAVAALWPPRLLGTARPGFAP